MRAGNTLDGIRKIAVLRANNLGDFIFALPALEALRSTYSDAEIVLLGTPLHSELLAGRPSPVDKVIVIPPSNGVREQAGLAEDPAELNEFFDTMQRERFDLAIQLHGGGHNSNPFVRRLGARVTVGLKTPDAEPLDLCMPYVYYQPEVLRYLEVVALVGADKSQVVPRLRVTERDTGESLRALPETSRPLAVLHPGATDPRRRWPVERFVTVGKALVEAGAMVAVTGTESEGSLCEGLVSALGPEAPNLCGVLSLSALVGVLDRASLLVSNDTGPLHLAEAVGTPTVGIYWCGNLILAGPTTRAHHRPVISWRLKCPVCGTNCIHSNCEHRESFVADVPADEVRTSALELLHGC